MDGRIFRGQVSEGPKRPSASRAGRYFYIVDVGEVDLLY